MAVYKVLEVGNKVLREQAKDVPKITKNIIKLLDNMADTLYDAKGLGLAAPQVGVSKRVVVIDVGEGLLELINPEILESDGERVISEGCLSVPGVFFDVPRPEKVRVRFTDRHGVEQVVWADDMLARVVQHEIDHLDGIIFTDLPGEPTK